LPLAGEAIDPGDHQHVAGPNEGEDRRKLLSPGPGGSGHLLLPDHGATCGRQGLALRACRKVSGVYGSLSMQAAWGPPNRRWRMILNALVEKLKRRSKDDFKGRHFEATLILQAVSDPAGRLLVPALSAQLS